jgi:hypothetical protein
MVSRQTLDGVAGVTLAGAGLQLARYAHFRAEEARAKQVVRHLKPLVKQHYNRMSSAINGYGLATDNCQFMEQPAQLKTSKGQTIQLKSPSLRLLNAYFYHAERCSLGQSAYVFAPGTGTSFEGKALSNAYLAAKNVSFGAYMRAHYPQVDFSFDVVRTPQDLKRLTPQQVLPFLDFAADMQSYRFVELNDRLKNWRQAAAYACRAKLKLSSWVKPSKIAAATAATWFIVTRAWDWLKS